MRGKIVRGVAGQRKNYRPVVSRLVASAEPIDVACAFRQQFGFNEFYLADLDAIQGQPPALAVVDQLHGEGFELWIDAGLRNARAESLATLQQANVAGIIIGLESIEGPDELERIVERAGERVILSLDLHAGQPLGRSELWHTHEAWIIAERAIVRLGIRRLIVLDLARVGVNTGVGTEELCARLKRTFPAVQITAGGGVRDRGEVLRLYGQGIDYVLVASALHDGRITPEEARQC